MLGCCARVRLRRYDCYCPHLTTKGLCQVRDKLSIYIVIGLILWWYFPCFKFNALIIVGPVEIPQQGNASNIIFQTATKTFSDRSRFFCLHGNNKMLFARLVSRPAL